MNKSEAEIQAEIQARAVAMNCKLMRNNSGALKDVSGRVVRFGLGNVSKAHNDRIKSSDLIGFTKVVITPDMVGKVVAVFTACEVKAPGAKIDNRYKAQLAFVDWIKSNGGIAAIVDSFEKFRESLPRV